MVENGIRDVFWLWRLKTSVEENKFEDLIIQAVENKTLKSFIFGLDLPMLEFLFYFMTTIKPINIIIQCALEGYFIF